MNQTTSDLQAFFASAEAEINRRRRLRAFYRLYHKLLWKKDALREVTRHGFRLNIRNSGELEKWLLKPEKGRWWEWHLVRYLFTQAHSRGCDVFLDIGANIGYYSLLAARVKVFKEIHAVEPIAEIFKRLTWHIEANDFANGITAHNFAVSDHEGTAQMLSANAGSHIIESGDKKEGEAVKTATLDSLFDFRGRKLAVKMDVEGHELAALHGAEGLLAQNDVFLQVEVWNKSTDTIEYLLSQGFKMVHFHGHESHYADFHFERKAL